MEVRGRCVYRCTVSNDVHIGIVHARRIRIQMVFSNPVREEPIDLNYRRRGQDIGKNRSSVDNNRNGRPRVRDIHLNDVAGEKSRGRDDAVMVAFGWPWVSVTDSGKRETNNPLEETRLMLAK